jgi:hypothetical protein
VLVEVHGVPSTAGRPCATGSAGLLPKRPRCVLWCCIRRVMLRRSWKGWWGRYWLITS